MNTVLRRIYFVAVEQAIDDGGSEPVTEDKLNEYFFD